MTWNILPLSSYAIGNQNAEWTADGSPSENSIYNCGPETLADTIAYLTGVVVSADTIKDILLGQGKTGTTTALQLQEYLRDYASTPSTIYDETMITSPAQLEYINWKYLVAGKPLIGLDYWESIGSPYLHWRARIGLSPSTVSLADTWTGSLVTESYDRHWNMWKGVLIGIDRARDAYFS